MYKYNQFYNNDANKDKDNIIKKKNAPIKFIYIIFVIPL